MAYISEKILDIIKAGMSDTATVIDVMCCSRPESYRKLRNIMWGMPSTQYKKSDKQKIRKENQKLYSTLSNLKREGFITKGKDANFWSITKLGLQKLDLFRKLAVNSKNEINYDKEKSKNIVIVAFDIPERLRSSRAWLRGALKFLDFSMIQKSVWVGNYKLPEEFIHDLEKREILKCVDIFEVGNKGTLERLNFAVK